MSSKLPNVKSSRFPASLVRPAAAERLAPIDAIEVHELIHRIYLAEDSRDYDALREAFTEDAVHEYAIYGRVQGFEAIVEFVQANLERGFDGVRHHALNIVTSKSGQNRAEAVSYVMPLKLFPGPGEGDRDLPRIMGHGVVRDRLIKQSGHWRVAHRIYDQFSIWPELAADSKLLAHAAESLEREK